MAGDDTSDFEFKLYRYVPSLAAAIIFTIAFGLLSTLHTWKIFRHRSFYFIAFNIGGYFQFLGYCGRIWSHFDQEVLGVYIMQTLLILVAPALFAASIYMILGRLIRALRAEQLSVIPVLWVTRVFVAGDVLSFTLQLGGGGIQAAGSLKLFELGEKVVVGGLFVQIIVFGFFMITTVIFHRRYVNGPIHTPAEKCVAWRRHLYVLYGVSALILIRSVFRVIEYLQGNGGYLISHEVFLYIFDALLMAMVMAALLIWYVDDLDTGRPTSEGVEVGLTEYGEVTERHNK